MSFPPPKVELRALHFLHAKHQIITPFCWTGEAARSFACHVFFGGQSWSYVCVRLSLKYDCARTSSVLFRWDFGCFTHAIQGLHAHFPRIGYHFCFTLVWQVFDYQFPSIPPHFCVHGSFFRRDLDLLFVSCSADPHQGENIQPLRHHCDPYYHTYCLDCCRHLSTLRLSEPRSHFLWRRS